MPGNDYETLRESRQAAIQSAANILQVLSDAKRLRKPLVDALASPTAEDTEEGGDFLFDLLRLNARYLNQLAAIGKSHTSVAQRALERFYSVVTPPGRMVMSEGLRLTRAAPAASFLVRNDSEPNDDTRLSVKMGRLEPPLLPGNTPWLKTIGGKKMRQPGDLYERPLALGEMATVHVEVNGTFPIARTYTAELVVELRSTIRRVPVVIDWRD